MPIHDQGYRRYEGRRQPHGGVWWVIARVGLRDQLRQRRFLGLLLLAWVPFVVRAVQLYIAANIPQAAPLFGPSPQLFRDFLGTQGMFGLFVAVFAGAGLIAHDRRANALQVYLSKPLTRVDYVAGKFAILFILLLAVTWLPGMLLLGVQVMLAGDTAFLREHLFLVPAVTLFAAVQVLISALSILALSALSTSARFAGILFAGLFFFSAALFQALRFTTGSRGWAWISPRDTLGALGDAIFRVPATPAISVPVALAAILVILAGSLWVLERRIRAVEVV